MSKIITFIFFLFLTIFVTQNALAIDISGSVSSYSMNTVGGVYNLTGDVTADGTALLLAANNVTLDGKNYTTGQNYNITYGMLSTGTGISEPSTRSNFIIKNVNLIQSNVSVANGYGMYLVNSNNGTINNCTATSNNARGIVLDHATNTTVSDCTCFSSVSDALSLWTTTGCRFINCQTLSNSHFGIYLSSSISSTVSKCISASNTSDAIKLLSSNLTSLDNLTGISISGHGIYLSNTVNNTLNDSIGTSTTSEAVYIQTTDSSNFTNVTGNSTNKSGFVFDLSNYNNISNSTGKSNLLNGLALWTSNFNIITNSKGISLITTPIYLVSSISNNFTGMIGISPIASTPHNSLHVMTQGDSITSGVYTEGGIFKAWWALTNNSLNNYKNGYTVSNVGVGGEKTADGKARFTQMLDIYNPQICTILYGANDIASRDQQGIIDDILWMANTSKNRGIEAYIILTPPTNNTTNNVKTIWLDENLSIQANDLGFKVINAYDSMDATPLNGIYDLADPSKFIDIVHPNDAGNVLISSVVSNSIIANQFKSSPYWIDSDNNLIIKTNLSTSPLYYNIITKDGYSPDPVNTLEQYDNFNTQNLSTNWVTSMMGVTTGSYLNQSNGKLTMHGTLNSSSSVELYYNKPFKNNIQFVVKNQSFTNSSYNDESIGNGTIKGESGTAFHHVMFDKGYEFLWQDLTYQNIRDTDVPAVPDTNIVTSVAQNWTDNNNTHDIICSINSDGLMTMGIKIPSYITNETKIELPLPDGSNQAVHPDVYYNDTGLFGHKYWMVVTHYTASNRSLENPSLFCSDDGINWMVPIGVTNPIDPFPGGTGYNSDPDMIYNSSTGNLDIYYRETDDTLAYDQIKLRTYNGLNVSNEVNCSFPERMLSPAILRNSNGTYEAYYVRNVYQVYNPVIHVQSTDGINFTNPVQVDMGSGASQLTNGIVQEPWHMDVTEKNENRYLLISYVDMDSTENHTLHIGTISGNNCVMQSTPVINRGTQTWNTQRLYRSSLVLDNDGNNGTVWYSTMYMPGWKWALGYTRINKVNDTWIGQTQNFTVPSTYHILTQNTNNTFINNYKYFMISKGSASLSRGGNRTIDEYYATKIGNDPKVDVIDNGNIKTVKLTPNGAISNYQVKIAGNLLGIDSNSQSFDIETMAEPISNFTTTQVGINSFSYQFNDTSTGSPTSWFWDFGDGNTSNLQNPLHIYGHSGNYVTRLNISNVYGNNSSTNSFFVFPYDKTIHESPIKKYTTSKNLLLYYYPNTTSAFAFNNTNKLVNTNASNIKGVAWYIPNGVQYYVFSKNVINLTFTNNSNRISKVNVSISRGTIIYSGYISYANKEADLDENGISDSIERVLLLCKRIGVTH